MSNVGYATLTVIPSLRGFTAGLNGGMGAAGSAAGGLFGNAFNRGVLGAVGGLALGGAVVRASGNFEAAMNRVQAVTQTTGAEFDRLSQRAVQLGQETKFSATEAADAMYNLSTAGLEVNEVYEALPGTMQLAAAAGIDLADAAATSAAIVNSLGLEVSDLAHANDVLTKAAITTNASVQSMGESFKYIGPVANIAGVSFEETTAALGLLADQGILADMAGTGLRRVIENLINPTAQQAGRLRELGIEVTDAAGNFIGFEGVVREFETSGADLADLFLLLGDRGGPVMAALLERGSDALSQLTQQLDESDGLAADVADTMNTGFNASLERAKSSAESLAIAIGDAGALGAMTALADGAAGLLGVVAQLPSPILAVGTALALLGPAVFVIGKLATGVGLLINQLILASAAASTFGSRMAALATNPWVVGIGVFAAAVGFLTYRFQENAREAQANEEAVRRLGEAYAEAASRGRQAELNQAISGLGDDTRAALETAGISLGEFVTIASDVVSATGEIDHAASSAFLTMNNEMFRTGRITDEQATLIREAFAEIVHGLEAGRSAYSQQVEDTHTAAEAAEVLGDRFAGAFDAGRAAAGAYGEVAGAAADAAGGQDELADETDDVAAEFDDATRSVETYMERLGELNRLTTGFHQAERDVHEALDAVAESLAENGNNLDQNTAGGLENVRAIEDLATSFVDLASAAEAAGEPQETVNGFLDYGAEAVRNFLEELGVAPEFIDAYIRDLGLIPPVVETTGDFNASGALEDASTYGENVGANFASGVARGIDAGKDEIDQAAQRAVGNAHRAAQAAGEIESPSRLFAREVGEPIAEGIAQGILNAIDAPESAMDELMGRIFDDALGGVSSITSGIGDVFSAADAQDRLEQARAAVAAATTPEERAEAMRDLSRAQLAAVSAQQDLVEAGQAWLDQGPEAESNFRLMAEAAGLAGDEIDRLVDQMGLAADAASSMQLTAGDLAPDFITQEELDAAADAAIFSEQARDVFRATIGGTTVGQIASFLSGGDQGALDRTLDQMTDAFHALAFTVGEDAANRLAARDLTPEQFIAAAEAMVAAAGQGALAPAGWSTPNEDSVLTGPNGGLSVRVFIGDRELTDIVRTEVHDWEADLMADAGAGVAP